MSKISRVDRGLLVALWLATSALQSAQAETPEPARADNAVETKGTQPISGVHDRIYAVINGRSIPTSDYEAAFTTLVRQRFYHGQIPESELAGVREEIKIKLVQRVVLLEEAERRNIRPDDKEIEATLAGYEKRYTASPQWQQNRELVLPELRRQLAEQSQVALLDKQVRDVPAPDDVQVRAYYDTHPELFTEPEKLRVSVILLAVDPSSQATTWQATREEAKAIFGRLVNGADFEEAARMHSSAYAEKGGDMGYLHRGMLPDGIQKKIDAFEVGKLNEPIDTLEGVAIFRLTERVAGAKREFVDVAQRARELLVRERQDAAWKSLIDRLVAKADVKFMHAASMEQREGAKN